MNKSMSLTFAVALIAPLILASTIGVGARADEASDSERPSTKPWAISRTYLLQRGYLDKDKRKYMGMALYTSEPDSYGAAFRCQKGRLYAFVAVKKVDLHELMTRRSLRAKKWVVSFSVDDNELRKEDWSTLLDGQVLAPGKRSSAREIFAAARRGTTIRIDPRFGKAVTVEVPGDSGGLFDVFERECGFKAA